MTVGELEDLLLASLLRRAGGTKRRWRLVLGPITVYDPATHPHCNWHVNPTGTAAENDTIERLLDDVRARHPRIC
ncbi:hypothetical protein [Stakelama saccharophila]|uniref:Uncharacterized protein n=1 Tax=Stakelama saccharophila TaxID=3075605 RepID=A0ABZ0BAZ9_9SPHN|nr:hypothetical protein [Stakelama sp. W311]WNO54453.1 hypothetical protein RPR59_04145 [Stakelama sp. W311]